MPITDLTADALTVIRNAVMAKKEYADIPGSNTLKSILEIFKKNNYVDNYKVIEDKKQDRIRVYLKFYKDHTPVINNIKKISRPGLHIYVKRDKIPYVLRGKGLAVISTSRGILTDRECRGLKIGGEVICYVW